MQPWGSNNASLRGWTVRQVSGSSRVALPTLPVPQVHTVTVLQFPERMREGRIGPACRSRGNQWPC